MLNSVDRKVIIKTLLMYVVGVLLFIYGFKAFNKIPFILSNPQIKAIMAILLVVAISSTKIPTELAFLISGILGSFVLGVSLSQYTKFLYNEASSTSIFMIIISGTVIAVIGRGDLLDRISKVDRNREVENYSYLQHEISIFCLFDKLYALIKAIKKKSEPIAAIVFLLQNMLLFVSSIVSASTFSAMLKTKKSRSSKENAYLNAGILCMCISGCLLMFFLMKSPWWLFFLGFEKNLNIQIQFPFATLIYAFFSFVHGYSLLLKTESFSSVESDEKRRLHPLANRHFIIYFGMVVVFLILTLPEPISLILKRNATSADINQGIIIILILILSSGISSTIITKQIMQKSLITHEKNDSISQLRSLMIGDAQKNSGIKSVIVLLVLIVTILAFRDMINACVNSGIDNIAQANQQISINFISSQGALALMGCLITFAIVIAIGLILGSNFGAFSIGLIIFSIISAKIPVLNNMFWKRWIIEGIIIVSTFCNQVSIASSNAGAVASEGENSKAIQEEAWKVESFLGYTALKIQGIAMFVCVILSGILTGLGIQ